MKQNRLKCGKLFMLIAFLTISLFGKTQSLYEQANGRLSQQGVEFMKSHFVNHTEPCPKISDVNGWWWACTYADGFTLYNCCRKCRGTIEVAKYFLGLSAGDCDAHTRNGKRGIYCFPRDAVSLYNAHGAVIAIERLNECRE